MTAEVPKRAELPSGRSREPVGCLSSLWELPESGKPPSVHERHWGVLAPSGPDRGACRAAGHRQGCFFRGVFWGFAFCPAPGAFVRARFLVLGRGASWLAPRTDELGRWKQVRTQTSASEEAESREAGGDRPSWVAGSGLGKIVTGTGDLT